MPPAVTRRFSPGSGGASGSRGRADCATVGSFVDGPLTSYWWNALRDNDKAPMKERARPHPGRGFPADKAD
jgi:hypothetical protein